MNAPVYIPLRWVTLAKYCELTGESGNAVHARRRRGDWIEGVHCRVNQGKVWVHLERAQRWVEGERECV